MHHLEEHNMLYKKQFGFRSKKSTELAVIDFVDQIRNNMNNGKLTGAVFIDLSKAFDTISHAAVLNKLPKYGVTSKELEWFNSYLFNRKQAVSVNGSLSTYQPVFSGVPQGSVLGPLLFLLHFNDIVLHLKHCEIVKYADDTVIYVNSKDPIVIQNKLTEDMKNISQWLSENDLIINLKKGKTESMLFGTSKRLNQSNIDLDVKLNGQNINNSKLYKYLGVKIDPCLTLTTFFDETYRKASGRLRLLNRIRQTVTVYTADRIYQSFVIPTIMYCAVCNLNFTPTQLNKLDRLSARASEIIKGSSKVIIKNRKLYDLMKMRSAVLVSKGICKKYELLTDYFTLMENNTRNRASLLRLPAVKLKVAKDSFRFMGAKLFNELPLSVRMKVKEKTFEAELKNHFKAIV